MLIEMFGWDVVCLGILDSLLSLRFVVLVGGGASFSIEVVHSSMKLLGACSLIIVRWMEGGLLGYIYIHICVCMSTTQIIILHIIGITDLTCV